MASKKKAIKVIGITGGMLCRLRSALGMTQTTFWKNINVTQSGGSRYEHGRKMPVHVELFIRMFYFDQTMQEAYESIGHKGDVADVFKKRQHRLASPDSNSMKLIKKELGLK